MATITSEHLERLDRLEERMKRITAMAERLVALVEPETRST